MSKSQWEVLIFFSVTCQRGGEQSLLFSSGGRLTSLQKDRSRAGLATGCGRSHVSGDLDLEIWGRLLWLPETPAERGRKSLPAFPGKSRGFWR